MDTKINIVDITVWLYSTIKMLFLDGNNKILSTIFHYERIAYSYLQ